MGWRTVAWTKAATVAALLVAGAAAEARADTIALTFNPAAGVSAAGGVRTNGYSFTTSAAVTVTQLGVWDSGANGLAEAHQVGIWTNSGTLVVSGTVQAGTADPLESGFRFTSILTGTTALAAGTYRIGALYTTSGDSVKFDVPIGSVTVAAPVSYGSPFLGFGAFTFPTTNAVGDEVAFIGPTFQFASAVVTPEPGTTALFGLGALGLAGVVVRRRRAARRAPASA